MLNTLIVASATTFFAITFGSLAAYAITRFRFPGTNAIPLFFLVMRMVPRIVIVLPYFVIMRQLGLLDSLTGLVLSYTSFALPFALWMMIGFFQDIPVDMEEAAMIDGCDRLAVLLRVTLPLAAPGLAATSVFAFLLGWNEFLFSLILTSSESSRTLPVVVSGFVTDRGIMWGEMSAAGTLIALPVIAFALMVQKYIVRGLTMGAVKG
jgi:multiple sugar transport system permease protein